MYIPAKSLLTCGLRVSAKIVRKPALVALALMNKGEKFISLPPLKKWLTDVNSEIDGAKETTAACLEVQCCTQTALQSMRSTLAETARLLALYKQQRL